MSRDICLQVFGKRWSELDKAEQVVALQYRRKAYHYRYLKDNQLRMRDSKRERKTKLLKVLGWLPQCVKCGYDRYIGALDFHHLDPTTKDNTQHIFNGSWERALEEARKCQLICSNCHREIHGCDDNIQQTGRPRKVDPLLEQYLRASGLTDQQVGAAMAGR